MKKQTKEKIEDWEKEFNELPQSKMTTKDFIRQLLSRREKEVLEEVENLAVESLEEVYGFLRKYREPDIINAFRERLKQRIRLKKSPNN